jgi:hypothetical protein
MGRNRTIGSPYQAKLVAEDFTTEFTVDGYMATAVPLVVTLDPKAVVNDQVLVQDATNDAGANPIVINASEGQTILNGYGSSISITTNGGGVLFTMTADGWVPQRVGSSSSSSVVPIPAVTELMTPGLPCPPSTSTQITPTVTFTPTGTRALILADFSAEADTGVTEVLFGVTAGAAQKNVNVSGIPNAGLAGSTWIGGSLHLLLTGLTPGTPVNVVTVLDPIGGVGGATTGSTGVQGSTSVIDLG